MSSSSVTSRSMSDEPEWAALATRLLRGEDALVGLSAAEARCVVSYMRLLRFPEGQVLFQEGEPAGNGAMLLLLDGEVTVDHQMDARVSPLVISVLGPGHLVGETALLDGGPRTATCTVTAPLLGAGLTRNALGRLARSEPLVATKLLAGVGQRLAERVRDLGRQRRVYHQLLGAMQGEIDTLQRQLQQVMDGAMRRAARTPPSPTEPD